MSKPNKKRKYIDVFVEYADIPGAILRFNKKSDIYGFVEDLLNQDVLYNIKMTFLNATLVTKKRSKKKK